MFWCVCVLQAFGFGYLLFVICLGGGLPVGVVLFEFNSGGLFLDAGLGFAVFAYLWFAC